MPENIQKIFSSNLNRLLLEHEKTQLELSKYVGVSNTAVNNWSKGHGMPRMDKVDRICSFFQIQREELLRDYDDLKTSGYYTNKETAKVAQEIFENKDLKVLFDAARDASPEDLKAVHTMLLALKAKEKRND